MVTGNVKEQMQDLIDDLPEEATWEDLMEQIYVRQSIEKGLKDSREGKTIEVTEVREKFNLKSWK